MPIELVRIDKKDRGYMVHMQDTDDVIRDEVINPGTDDERQVIEYQRFKAYVPADTAPADVRGILQAAVTKTDDDLYTMAQVKTKIESVIANINRSATP